MIIENDGGNDYTILPMRNESIERRGLFPWVLDVTPTANAWLNPTKDDDSDQDSNSLDDDTHVPRTTATPTVNGWRRRRKCNNRCNYEYRCLTMFI